MDTILRIFQVIFYAVGSIVAVVTYFAARRGLLNTVNTEYYKKVIDQLYRLSVEIYEEFDDDSDKHWIKSTDAKEFCATMNERLLKFRHEFLTSADDFDRSFPSTRTEMRLHALEKKYNSDPFLPRKIREKLIKLLQDRQDAIRNANKIAAMKYRKYLKANPDWSKIDDNWHWVHNVMMDELYSAGYGVAQVEERVNDLRDYIQSYFEEFNPYTKTFGNITSKSFSSQLKKLQNVLAGRA